LARRQLHAPRDRHQRRRHLEPGDLHPDQ